MQRHRMPLAVRRGIVLLLALAILLGAGFGLWKISAQLFPAIDAGKQLPVTSDAAIEAFGDKVLTFDGTTFNCFDINGNNLWSFPAEVGSQFSVSEENVVIWKGRIITMLEASGTQIFSNEIEAEILDARVSANYVAIQIGSLTDSQIIVLDKKCQQIDEESFPGRRLLDFGFFGNTTDMLWTMALDTSGRVPVTYVATYQPGKNINGFLTVSDQLLYRAMFYQSEIILVGSQNILTANYAESKLSSDIPTLVYGWYMKSSYISDGGLHMVFAPSPEPGTTTQINDLRAFQGNAETAIHIPTAVDDVLCGPNHIFGFSGNMIYVYDYAGNAIDSAQLRFSIDRVIGLVGKNRAAVISGTDVHIIRLR